MFGWFRSEPKCPISDQELAWIEQRFQWLIVEFGLQRLQQGTLVLPTKNFFPSEYEETEEEILELMDSIAIFMDVDPSTLRLHFYKKRHPKFDGSWKNGTASYYQEVRGRFNIALERSILEDPMLVVGTLAHEIGYVVLLGQQRISPSTEDCEQLTELLTVFLGMGVFTGNAAFHDVSWSDGQFNGTASLEHRGFLNLKMYGYAFALYAVAREDFKPTWLKHLRLDIRTACKNGIRYITSQNDQKKISE